MLAPSLSILWYYIPTLLMLFYSSTDGQTVDLLRGVSLSVNSAHQCIHHRIKKEKHLDNVVGCRRIPELYLTTCRKSRERQKTLYYDVILSDRHSNTSAIC